MDAMGPENLNVLTPKQNKKSMRYVNLIQDKRWDKIKGRTCADGNTQRGYIPKEEALLPTIFLEVIMANFMVDKYEGLYVATFDIPLEYLNPYIPY